MRSSRNDEWSDGKEVFTARQVEAVLTELGIDVREETDNDFLSYCPFHSNHDSPAFSTSKRYGYSICFNPACAVGSDEPLTLEKVARRLAGMTVFEAKRLVRSKRSTDAASFKERFDAITDEPEEQRAFPAEAIETMYERFWKTPQAIEYMKGRGFTEDTLRHFKVGFAPAATGYGVPVYRPVDMVMVPAYDHKGRPVGVIGRSIEGKEFKNYGPDKGGKGFHKSKIVWNLQNAKASQTAVVVEAGFDGMMVHQAGYPNVVGLLGGTLSETQKFLLKRHFDHLIIMTDNEVGRNVIFHPNCRACIRAGNSMCVGHKPGRELGMKIAGIEGMKISWSSYDDKEIYPNGSKDACAMGENAIRQCLRNSISHFEYLDWVES